MHGCLEHSPCRVSLPPDQKAMLAELPRGMTICGASSPVRSAGPPPLSITASASAARRPCKQISCPSLPVLMPPCMTD